MKGILVFTDLDGTLLDHDTYMYTEADPTLATLAEASIPVILCTSKTRAETEIIHDQMKLQAPFIVENGAAIFVPKQLLDCVGENFMERDHYLVREFGTPYEKILRVWHEMKSEKRYQMTGFSEMSLEEICRETGLSREAAQRAALREYSEPFTFHDSPENLVSLKKNVSEKGLQVTKGGRFFHLVGRNDKGKAVRLLKKVYEKTYPEIVFTTVGLGDSANDIAMLESVDVAVVIKKKQGGWEQIPGLTDAIYSQKPGPAGWAEEIIRLLSSFPQK